MVVCFKRLYNYFLKLYSKRNAFYLLIKKMRLKVSVINQNKKYLRYICVYFIKTEDNSPNREYNKLYCIVIINK